MIPALSIKTFKGVVSNIADHLIPNENSPFSINTCVIDGRLQPLPGFTRVSATPLTPANKDEQYVYLNGHHYKYSDTNGRLEYETGIGGSTSGLVSYWLFEDDTTTTTAGGTANTLSENGTITRVNGQFGYAHEFNASGDYWSITDASQSGLDIVSTFTITMQIKVSDYTNAARGLLGKGTNAYRLRINTSGKVVVSINNSDVATSSRTVPTGVPFNLAVVFDDTANTVSIYIDAVLDSTTTSVTGVPTNNASAFTIGLDGNSNNFGGTLNTSNFIDEVSIWTRALTASEIDQIVKYGILSFVTAVGTYAAVESLALPAQVTLTTNNFRNSFWISTGSSQCSATASTTIRDTAFDPDISEEATYLFYQTYYSPSKKIESAPSPIATQSIVHSCSDNGSNGSYWAYLACRLTLGSPDYSWAKDCVIKLYGGGSNGMGFVGTFPGGVTVDFYHTPSARDILPEVYTPRVPPRANAIFTFSNSLFLVRDREAYYSRFPTTVASKLAFSDDERILFDVSEDDNENTLVGGIETSQFAIVFNKKSIWGITGETPNSFENTLIKLTGEFGGVNKYSAVSDKLGNIYIFGGDAGVIRITQRFELTNIATQILDIIQGDNTDVAVDTSAYNNVRSLYDPRRNWIWFFVTKSGSSENDLALIWDINLETWYIKDNIPGRAAWRETDADGQVSLYTIDAAGYQYQISDNAYLDYSMGGTTTGSPTSSVGSGVSTLTDTGASFTTNGQGLTGAYIILVEGTTIVKKKIASNTGTVITISGTWGTAFTTAATYYIGYQDFDWYSKQFTNESTDLKDVVRDIAIAFKKSSTSQLLYTSVYTDYNSTAKVNNKSENLNQSEIPVIINISQRFNFLQLRLRSITATKNPLIREINIPIQAKQRVP